MKSIALLSSLLLILLIGACKQKTQDNTWHLVEVQTSGDSSFLAAQPGDTLYNFHLIYCYAGMGVNAGTQQPFFEIKDSFFVFTRQITGRLQGQPVPPADTIQTGIIRPSSVDSIIGIVTGQPQRGDIDLNLDIPDGGFVTLSINAPGIDFHRRFANCSDVETRQIVEILDTYLAPSSGLPLYDQPCEDNLGEMAREWEENQ